VTPDPAGVELSICESCHAGYFPHRLICPNCGACAWRLAREGWGIVEETTTVHRRVGADCAPTALATIRLDGGQRVVAGLTQTLPRGSRVALTQTEGSVWASVKQP
jgi:uncharacterized OB-fold protein